MATVHAVPRPAVAARRWRAEDPIIGVRLVVDRFAKIPTFGSDVWSLACLGSRPNRIPFKLDFTRLPPRWRPVAKEIIAHRINEPVPSLRTRRRPRTIGPGTCEAYLQSMVPVFDFIDRQEVGSIPALTPEHLEAFRAEISGKPTSGPRRFYLLKVFDMFRESRDHLSGGGLAFHPWPGANLTAIAEMEAREECQTERIPEDVMGSLLFWALAYVDRFSEDIIAAEAETRRGPGPSVLAEAERRARLAAPEQFAAEAACVASGWTPRALPIRNAKRIEIYLEGLAASGDGVPAKIFKGRIVPDVERIATAAGVAQTYVATSKDKGKVLIVGSGLPLRLEHLSRARARLPGARRTWRGRFTAADLKRECRMLQVAAYIVIAYLSGMRDSEVQTLTRGCLSVLKDARGEVFRYKVAGLVWKNRRRRPQPRKWVVIEPVARAVRALERLTEHFHRSQRETYLFSQLDHRDDSMGLFKEAICKELNAFAVHCRDRVAPRQVGAELPPAVEPWRFKSPQFRRTLAWHIANQPFGVVAGMIQYGHASIQMFEGYAGTSESGFAAEVVNEEVLARLSDLTEMFEDDRRGVRCAGPMADELSEFFRRKREEIGDFPGEVADDKRLRGLLRNKAADLHPGPLVHCFYTPANARCQHNMPEEERATPAIALCDPDCPNACWSRKNLEAWRTVSKDCEKLLAVNSVPRRQSEIVRRQSALAHRVISAIEAAAVGEGSR